MRWYANPTGTGRRHPPNPNRTPYHHQLEGDESREPRRQERLEGARDPDFEPRCARAPAGPSELSDCHHHERDLEQSNGSDPDPEGTQPLEHEQ